MNMKVLHRDGVWGITWVTPETLADDMAKNPNLAVMCRALSLVEFEALNKEFKKHDITLYCVKIGDLVLAYASVLRKRKGIYTKKYLRLVSSQFRECPANWIRE